MKTNRKMKSWLQKKLENSRFHAAFQEEYQRLSIGEQIVRLRIASGLTQAELAKKVGTTASAISRYENAEYDRYEVQTLRKISEACGGRLTILLGPGEENHAAA